MPTCFYHPTHDSETTCIGCKMPVCQVCQDEGKNGFCGPCFKKVAGLSAQVTDTKKTGFVAASQKATMVKNIGRPTGPMNVSYCFHHFDAVASGTCHTCSRPFCMNCLNDQGICSHCEKLADEAPTERKAPPPPRPAAPARPVADRPRPTADSAVTVSGQGEDKTKAVLIGVIVLLAVAVVVLLLRR